MKITKKQIKALDKGETTARELFPEVFETKLEVCKWYKHEDRMCLAFIKELKKTDFIGYGFDYKNEWISEKNNWTYGFKEWEPATDQEVSTALINEAKKRGFENIDKLSILDPYGDTYEKGSFLTGYNVFIFEHNENNLYLDGIIIFNKGKWAEIIKHKQMTKEEIEKELGYQIEII